MEVIKYPNPVLREVSEPVKLPLSKEDKELLDKMFKYVKEHQDEAVGLFHSRPHLNYHATLWYVCAIYHHL